MRTPDQIAEGYRLYRGRCYEMSKALCDADPSLRLVRGHITVPMWPTDPLQPHWWCVRQNGSILDPSWEQFPFQQAPPASAYEEFDGTVYCDQCGKEGREENYKPYSNYIFCSNECGMRFVGL